MFVEAVIKDAHSLCLTKGHFFKRKFRFEWHIAHSRALEKLICTVFILNFRDLPKKSEKSKNESQSTVNSHTPMDSGSCQRINSPHRWPNSSDFPQKWSKQRSFLHQPHLINSGWVQGTAVLQTSSCPKTKLTGVQEFWWALIKGSGFVPCLYPHVDKKILRVMEEWVKCLHLKQSRQSRSPLSHVKS